MKLVDWQEERMAIIASAVLTTPVNKETPVTLTPKLCKEIMLWHLYRNVYEHSM